MNNIIRNVNGYEITFHHDSYYQVNWWLESQRINYDQFNIVVDPATFQPVPCAIRFHKERDLTMFMLRWS